MAVFRFLAPLVSRIFVALPHCTFALVAFVHAIPVRLGVIDDEILVQLLITEPVDCLSLVVKAELDGVVLVVLVTAHGTVTTRGLKKNKKSL